MKRYRLFSFDIDSQASSLEMEIKSEWDEEVKKLHRIGREELIQQLIRDYGSNDFDVKVTNLIDMGDFPLSILAFHNRFLRQIKRSFIMGGYYPSLTATCALGERILNYLVLILRDYFKSSNWYKRVYDKESFDNWDLPINALEAWEVLLPDVVQNYKKLRDLRNQALHFNPEIDTNDRDLALQAIKLLKDIVGQQFSAFGIQPWFILDTPGASFIKKDYEEKPFIKCIYLPKCYFVGPDHTTEIKLIDGIFRVFVTDKEYEPIEIADEEFASLYNISTH